MDKCGVVRTEESLTEAVDMVRELRHQERFTSIDDHGTNYNTELLEAFEFGFLIDLAEVTAVAARARTESRGGHWRDDYPTRDDGHWLKHSLAYRMPDGSIDLRYKPVTITKYMPMERKY